MRKEVLHPRHPIRATFPNERRVLVPGVFVRAMVETRTTESLLIPETALQRDVVGSYALIVDDQSIVRRRDVELGAMDGRDRVILTGLEPGDRVIINGLQRAQPGNPVKAVEAGS